MSKPTIGRIVHYVLPSGPSVLEHRAAIITGVRPSGEVDLHVFFNGPYDPTPAESLYSWVGCVRQDEVEHGPNTWHWPERQAGE